MSPDETELRTAALNYFYESKQTNRPKQIIMLVFEEEIEERYSKMKEVWEKRRKEILTMKLQEFGLWWQEAFREGWMKEIDPNDEKQLKILCIEELISVFALGKLKVQIMENSGLY